MSLTLSCSCIMLRSCLPGVSDLSIARNFWSHTLGVAHPCTGSQSCSLCKTDTGGLRRISVCAFGSGYKPAWREPACAVSAVRRSSRTGPCTGSGHKRPGHTEQQTAAEEVVGEGGKAGRCYGV